MPLCLASLGGLGLTNVAASPSLHNWELASWGVPAHPRWSGSHVVVLWVLGVCGLGVSRSHTAGSARLLELVAFGRTRGFISPYSLVSSSLVEGLGPQYHTSSPSDWVYGCPECMSWCIFGGTRPCRGFDHLGACRVPHPRSGHVPDIFANNSLMHVNKKWLKEFRNLCCILFIVASKPMHNSHN